MAAISPASRETASQRRAAVSALRGDDDNAVYRVSTQVVERAGLHPSLADDQSLDYPLCDKSVPPCIDGNLRFKPPLYAQQSGLPER